MGHEYDEYDDRHLEGNSRVTCCLHLVNYLDLELEGLVSYLLTVSVLMRFFFFFCPAKLATERDNLIMVSLAIFCI
jgi:hypothetical protein